MNFPLMNTVVASGVERMEGLPGRQIGKALS